MQPWPGKKMGFNDFDFVFTAYSTAPSSIYYLVVPSSGCARAAHGNYGAMDAHGIHPTGPSAGVASSIPEQPVRQGSSRYEA